MVWWCKAVELGVRGRFPGNAGRVQEQPAAKRTDAGSSFQVRRLAPSPRRVVGEARALWVDSQIRGAAVQPRLEEVHFDDIVAADLYAESYYIAQPDLHAKLALSYASGRVLQGLGCDARSRWQSPGAWKLAVIVGSSYEQDPGVVISSLDSQRHRAFFG